MPRNCPYCDLYTIDDNVCVHCGEKLPNDNQQFVDESITYSKPRSSGMGFFSKFIAIGVFVLVCFLGYKLVFSSSEVPSYMDAGPIYLKSKIVPGKINIFDFYSDYCGPCKQISPYLKKLKAKRNDLNIEQININRPDVRGIDWQSPIVKQFKIKSIPFFIVIDKNGKIEKEGKSAYKYVIKTIQNEGL